jgi:hypothetical protein
MTRPITPLAKTNFGVGHTYVAWVDCGQQFEYDTTRMCLGKRLAAASKRTGHIPFQESAR